MKIIWSCLLMLLISTSLLLMRIYFYSVHCWVPHLGSYRCFFRYCLFFINFVLIISSHKLRFTRNRQETNTLILSFKLFCRKNLQSKNPICITRNLESFELKRCSILSYKLQNTSCSATHVYYFLKPLNKVNCVIL